MQTASSLGIVLALWLVTLPAMRWWAFARGRGECAQCRVAHTVTLAAIRMSGHPAPVRLRGTLARSPPAHHFYTRRHQLTLSRVLVVGLLGLWQLMPCGYILLDTLLLFSIWCRDWERIAQARPPPCRLLSLMTTYAPSTSSRDCGCLPPLCKPGRSWSSRHTQAARTVVSRLMVS